MQRGLHRSRQCLCPYPAGQWPLGLQQWTGHGRGSSEERVRAWWSSSSQSDSLMMADREAPMPPVFMHSSTTMAWRVFLILLLMASMSKGFRLIRSITCTPDTSLSPNIQYRFQCYVWLSCYLQAEAQYSQDHIYALQVHE